MLLKKRSPAKAAEAAPESPPKQPVPAAAQLAPDEAETGFAAEAAGFELNRPAVCGAVHIEESGAGTAGELMICYLDFLFKTAADKPHHPGVSGRIADVLEPFRFEGDTLVIRAREKAAPRPVPGEKEALRPEEKEYRFMLSPGEKAKAEENLARRRKLKAAAETYGDPLIESCIRDSWPKAGHPFIRKHGLDAPRIRELFRLLTSGEAYRSMYETLEEPLPWLDGKQNVSIRSTAERLSVEFGDYTYTETPDMIHFLYYDCAVGFFDDSGYEKGKCCMLEEAPEPETDAAHSPRKTGRDVLIPFEPSERFTVQDPCGLKGAYRITRHSWGS